MKRGVWLFVGLLLVVLVAQAAVWLRLHIASGRDSFVVLPHSVVLETLAPQPTPTADPATPELAGLTADDVVRGLLILTEDAQGGVTAAQAATLLPTVRKMSAARLELLTLRHERHADNEAAMEDALAIARVLSDRQLRTVIANRPADSPRPITTERWQALMERWR